MNAQKQNPNEIVPSSVWYIGILSCSIVHDWSPAKSVSQTFSAAPAGYLLWYDTPTTKWTEEMGFGRRESCFGRDRSEP